jgi:hypothetical protein
MTRQISITISGELGGIAPDPTVVREHILNAMDDTNSTILNSHISITTNDKPVPVLSDPPKDCTMKGCYEPMPHTHGTDAGMDGSLSTGDLSKGPVSDEDR